MAAALSCENVTYRYDIHTVLKDFGFAVEEGETFGVLGRNGCGKSTLMSLLTGLSPLQTGSVSWQGQKVDPLSSVYRENFGVVFQRPSLDLKLTVQENLKLTAKLRGLTTSSTRSRIAASLELANLSSHADTEVSKLSGGMRRRLDIARALLHEPALLFLDEPTSGLDELAYRETWSAIQNLREERSVTIFLVTHRSDEAERCDNVLFLDRGKSVLSGSPAVLRAQVDSDVIVLTSDEAKSVSKIVAEEFHLNCTPARNEVIVECRDGHLLIPRIVEKLGAGRIQSISLRQATMADVFLKVTGHSLLGGKTAEERKKA